MTRAASLVFLVLSLTASVVGKQPAPKILGLRLGMSCSRAYARLNEIGQFKSEDEGQQVWTLSHDKHYQYVIIGFDRDRNVRYVTVLARPDGQPVNYADVGNLADATRSGGEGNLRYTWKANDKKGHFEYLAIAKGKDPRNLTRYAVKRLGVATDEDERD
ncbi:MAG TPA: hypothetical protein VGO27_10410 [Candidatus Acidoferrum sp.]|jgi:hypothetical protein|nr:hypothetical protein [Candidatus Acidoferrum sp.]